LIKSCCRLTVVNQPGEGIFSVHRSIAVAATIAVISTGVVLSMSSPAAAVGGNCQAWSEKKPVDWQPDKWRVAGQCSSLNADTKARGYGEADGPDHYTPWFTQLNVTKYGAWGIIGIDRTSVQMERV
jgi:hypothetical protein